MLIRGRHGVKKKKIDKTRLRIMVLFSCYLKCGPQTSSSSYAWGAVQKRRSSGASLVEQWLRICLPMQGTRVRALVWEDPTCRGATGPVSHKY